MKYKLINEFKLLPGASLEYLKSLGIKKISSFMKEPSKEDYADPFMLENMKEAIEIVASYAEQNKKFFIQVDADTDGFTSASIFYNFMHLIYPNLDIQYRVHNEKQHGVIIDTIPEDIDIIIIPDAGSNQVEEQKILSGKGKQVIILDHHLVDGTIEKIKNCCIVNNQISDSFSNKSLSGAGVVYKFIQAFESIKFGTTKHTNFIDLAAVGIIADAMDSRDLDNNIIIYNGLRNIKNDMLQSILELQKYSVSNINNPNKIDIAFYVAPLINAVIRSGTPEEKRYFFEGFITKKDDSYCIETKKPGGEERTETLHQYLARTASNLRAKQNRSKEKTLIQINQYIDFNKSQNNAIIVVLTDDIDILSTISGLVATEIVKKYNRPALILTNCGNGIYRGSGRAVKFNNFDSFKDELVQSNAVEYAAGHDMALGIEIKEECIPKLLEYFNNKYGNEDFTPYNEVNCVVDNANFDKNILREFIDLDSIYGNGISEPKFYFHFEVPSTSFKIQGKELNSIRVNSNDISFLMFKCKDVVNQLAHMTTNVDELIDVEIIGKPNLNVYMGKETIQIIIEKIELKCNGKRKAKKLF